MGRFAFFLSWSQWVSPGGPHFKPQQTSDAFGILTNLCFIIHLLTQYVWIGAFLDQGCHRCGPGPGGARERDSDYNISDKVQQSGQVPLCKVPFAQ